MVQLHQLCAAERAHITRAARARFTGLRHTPRPALRHALRHALPCALRPALLCALLSLPNLAIAAVGDECEDAGQCGPGELCLSPQPGAPSKICTARCRVDEPTCPEPFACVNIGNLLVCGYESPRAALGEECSPQQVCDDDLSCISEGGASYCSVACVAPGSCPVGFECRLSEQGGVVQMCGRAGDAASVGNPCVTTRCAEGLECIDPVGERDQPYCSYPCEGLTCPPLMSCEGAGEEARCRFSEPSFREGDSCVLEGRVADQRTLGCGPDLSCEPEGLLGRCARLCGPEQTCAAGQGCVTPAAGRREDGRGVCRQGGVDEPGLSYSGEGAAGGASPAGETPYTPPYTPPPEPEEGGAAAPPAEGASCATRRGASVEGASVEGASGGAPLALALALLLAARYRSQGRRAAGRRA